MPFPDITSPVLLLDERKCRRNIARMTERAREHGLAFRPHFKTHQSRRVGAWLRDAGTEAITVSSVLMAEYFAADGWKDITIAFPHNPRETARVDRLAGACRLGLLVESPAVARQLDEKLRNEVAVSIKIDAGYGRTGVRWDDRAAIDAILDVIDAAPRLHFRGTITHGGDTYHAAGPDDVRRRFDTARTRLIEATGHIRRRHPDAIVSVGDTPGCALAEDFTGIDEIRPGNFVFFDIMQAALGICDPEDIAVATVCPVVAMHPERREAVVHGGSVHLSKDALPGEDGSPMYGRVVLLTEDGWSAPIPDTAVVSISQEHGVIRSTDEIIALLHEGALIGILPVHSCLTAQCMRGYLTLDGTPADHLAGTAHSLHLKGDLP